MGSRRTDNTKDLPAVETASVTNDDSDDGIEVADNDTTFISSERTRRKKVIYSFLGKFSIFFMLVE